MPRITMLDIAKMNGRDAVVGLIEEVQTAAPEVSVFDARTIKGTSYRTLLRTGLPSTGFRKVNGGFAASKSTFESKLVQCFVAGGRVEVDKATLQASEDGPEFVKATEASGVMESALQNIGKQIYYGTSLNADGFPGLQAMVNAAMVVDATGSTATTGSSVYAVRMGPRFVQLLFGNGDAMALSDWRDETLYDANNLPFPGEVADLCGWVGLQCVSQYAVARIKNLTADSGKGLTDSLLADLLQKFPAGTKPDFLFMSRRSCTQLQKSRTVVLSGQGRTRPDQEVMAPRPTSFENVPIVETDSILNTEAIA